MSARHVGALLRPHAGEAADGAAPGTAPPHDQVRVVLSVDELCDMPLQTPELQRVVDDERVDNIVQFQDGRIRAGLAPLFIGDLTLASSADAMSALTPGGADDAVHPTWLVDGQHRFGAMRRLRALHGERAGGYEVGVTVLRLSASLSLAAAFQLVNRAVPVPQYIVDGTLNAARRTMMDRFGALFTARFKRFLSKAAMPRRPHVNLAQLQDRIHDAAHVVDAFSPNSDALFEYVMWCNAALRDVDAALRERADTKAASGAQPAVSLCLRSDDTYMWLDDPRWLKAFLTGSPPPPMANATRNAAAAAAVPAAVRFAVWNRDFGVREAVGACSCCAREITVQAFEAGHIIAAARGGPATVDNLRCVCGACNRSMGTRNMDEFRATHFGTDRDT